MKAELNERNEVVVTMSRGLAQRLAEAAESYGGTDGPRIAATIEFSCVVQDLGIELWLQK